VDACIEDGKCYEIEHRIIRADGETRWILELGDAVRDSRGRPTRMVGVSRDITHNKESVSRLERAFSELASREAMLLGIVAAAPIGIGLVVNRVFQWTNDTLHQMTGYGAHEMRGQSARMLYPDQAEFERVGREKYRQIDERGIGSVLTRWIARDGREMRILLSSSPVDESDLGRGVIFTAIDSRLCDTMVEGDGKGE
jgi:two-component system CheB/CheR fusion protein